MLNKRRLSYERKKQLFGWVFVLPWLIGLIYFFLVPIAYSIINSFCRMEYSTGKISFTYVGLEYYKEALFSNQYTIPSLVQSIIDLFYQVPLVIVFSMFVAIILNQEFHGRIFLRGIFFLPLITSSGIVLSVMKGDVFAQSMISGEANSALFKVTSMQDLLLASGLPSDIISYIFDFINNIFDLVWKSGIQILLFLSGLQTISGSLYEAASIEGATAWEMFWKITFPMLSPIILLNFIYTIIDSFTDSASNTVMLNINNLSRSLQFGESAALSWVYFSMVGVVLGVIMLIAKKIKLD